MTGNDAIKAFYELAADFYEKEDTTEAEFWKLQVAARDAVIAINVSSGVLLPALFEVLNISQTLLDGNSASFVKKGSKGWSISAATGENAAILSGAWVNPDDNSVSSQVIKGGKPFCFSTISEFGEVVGKNQQKRYRSDYFCSFPVHDEKDEMIGILNVAGMSGAHPLFESQTGALDGFVNGIGIMLSNLERVHGKGKKNA